MADLMLLPIVHRAFLIAACPIGDQFYNNLDFANFSGLVRWYSIFLNEY